MPPSTRPARPRPPRPHGVTSPAARPRPHRWLPLAVFLLFHGVDMLNPFMIATMAASGVAVLVGWSVAWRSAVRARARLVLAAE